MTWHNAEPLEGPIVDFWSPGRIGEFLAREDKAFRRLDARILGSDEASNGFKAEWRAFFLEWAEFFEDHDGWVSRMSTSVVTDAERFQRERRIFRDAFVKQGGEPGLDLAPAREPQTIGSPFIWAAVGAGTVVALSMYLGRRR